MEQTIPVLLLTGYLGSGKTTLVNKILNNRKGIKFAVIVNDLGEVNIDADLIQKDGLKDKTDSNLVALQNGCICCTLKMDLVEQIRDIIAAGKFDYILIEASGICEPEPIANTICSMSQMDDDAYTHGIKPRLDCIVTVVDALRMRDEFACAKDLLRGNLDEEDIENLVIQQVEFCDRILLNKASEISAEDLSKVQAIIRTLQPRAEIRTCDFCDVEMESLLNTGLFDYNTVASSAAWVVGVEKGANVEDDDDDDDHGHHHHHDHDHEEGEAEEYGIGTYVYFNRKPFDINKFDRFVSKTWPSRVIRAKGICYFADQPDNCYLFEQAGSQISMKSIGAWLATMPYDELQEAIGTDPQLRRDWDPVYGDRMQKLVFIGQHLDKSEIKSALDFCLQD